MKLVISLATRGRPQQLIETVSKSLNNWRDENTLMVIALDADDVDTINHLNLHAPHAWFVGPSGPRVHLNVAPREDTIAAKWNRALTVPADVYLVAADDDPYITEGYDAKILQAAEVFPDGIGMVYGRMANASFSGVVAPTAKLCEKMGNKIFPEYFPYWFVDHWTDDLARLIGRISFADVTTDQSRAGRTQEMREPAWWATWFDAAYLMRQRNAQQILDSGEFQSPDWEKTMLRNAAPLVEYRSRWINDNVRAQAPQLAQAYGNPAPDERYTRLKQAAINMIPQLIEGMPMDEAKAFVRALVPPQTVQALPQAVRAA